MDLAIFPPLVKGTAYVLFHCSCCGGVWRRVYLTHAVGRHVTYWRDGWAVSLRADALCRACGIRGSFAVVRGCVTITRCGDACRRAQAPVCCCECGGVNHGAAHSAIG